MKKKLTTELLNTLSDRFGDTFYLLESESFIENYTELSKAFKSFYPKFNIAYSYKTNYTPKLARIVESLGGYAEVVSEMELQIALRSGVAPAHIIWNGPIKSQTKVMDLLVNGGTVNVDSIIELEELCQNPETVSGKTLNIGLRCNYDVGDGVLSRFGFDVDGEEFDKALSMIANNENLHLYSLQAHFAKRSPEYWPKRASGMLKVYDYVVERYGMRPETVDLGGGIYGNMPEELRIQLGIGTVSFVDYASRAATLFSEHFKDDPHAPVLFLEPGTALAGDCMRFVTRVETIKHIRGKTFAAVRGSQKNISMSGIIPPYEIIPGGNERQEYSNVDIVGFTCIEGDVLCKNYNGPLACGDYLVIGNCGSYSLVMKPPFILPNFPVLDICGDEVEIIKQAECFENLFSTYLF